MTYPKFRFSTYRIIRDHLNKAVELADNRQAIENNLISMLRSIDNDRYFVAGGFKSLGGFCRTSLQMSRLEAQSIVTRVRRSEPMVKIGKKEDVIGGSQDA